MTGFGASFGRLIREKRAFEDLSQRELASLAGVTSARISDLENGKISNPHAKTIDAICVALTISREERERCRDQKTPALRKRLALQPAPALFFGRTTLKNQIVAAISAGKGSVLLQGTAGVGKTALTLAVLHDPVVVEHFGTNRFFMQLDSVKTSLALQSTLMIALGLDPTKNFELALDLLRKRKFLLILDNLETPWEPIDERADTEATLARLADISNVTIVASFRGRSQVGGPAWGVDWRVSPIPLSASRMLFLAVAGERFAGEPMLQQLLRALGGLPLAIRLVAKQAHSLSSLTEIWQQWQSIGTDLARDPDYEADRLTSLSHSIELSVRSSLLTKEACMLLRLLARLPNGISFEDRDAVLNTSGFQSQVSLLRTGLADEIGNRIDLLPPIRRHILDKRFDAKFQFTSWYLVYLQKVIDNQEIGFSGSEKALQHLAPEFHNIEEALMEAIKSKDLDHALSALKGFGRLAFNVAASSTVLSALPAACRNAKRWDGEGTCHEFRGDVALAQGDTTGAEAAYKEARVSYQRTSSAAIEASVTRSLAGVASVTRSLGNVELARAQYVAARNLFIKSLLMYRGLPRSSKEWRLQGQANSLSALANVALIRGRLDWALRALHYAKAMFQEICLEAGVAKAFTRIGFVLLDQGNASEAKLAFISARNISLRHALTRNIQRCDLGLAEAASLYGSKRAVASLVRLRHDFENGASQLDAGRCIVGLARAAIRDGRQKEAGPLLRQALKTYQYAKYPKGEADCLLDLAKLRNNLKFNIHQVDLAKIIYMSLDNMSGVRQCLSLRSQIEMELPS